MYSPAHHAFLDLSSADEAPEITERNKEKGKGKGKAVERNDDEKEER